jgi:hypothetical protein
VTTYCTHIIKTKQPSPNKSILINYITIYSFFAQITAFIEIILSAIAAASTRLFSKELSGRLVGYVLLALLAAVTISIIIYALVEVFKKKTKPLKIVSHLYIHTYVPLTLYPRRGSKDISDIPPRH